MSVAHVLDSSRFRMAQFFEQDVFSLLQHIVSIVKVVEFYSVIEAAIGGDGPVYVVFLDLLYLQVVHLVGRAVVRGVDVWQELP